MASLDEGLYDLYIQIFLDGDSGELDLVVVSATRESQGRFIIVKYILLSQESYQADVRMA